MQVPSALLAFNRGLVSRLGLARVDVKRIANLSAEVMTNFLPRVLGSMSIRPGWKYLGGTNGFLTTKLIPFVFAVNDTAIIEITASTMRVWRNDELITRESVGTGITNGTFDSDLTGWTDTDEAGATSAWATGGYMELLGDETNAAIRDQEVTVAGGDVGVEHAVLVTIAKGPVSFRIGSSVGGEDYVSDTALGAGLHSLAFTPSGNFWIRFYSRFSRPVWVDSIVVESSGVMTVTAPWAASDLDNIRWDQSGDIVFIACAGQQQRLIERRGIHSWSIVKYQPIDGPFRIENISKITLTPSALTGSITLTASKGIFRTTHVGALFLLTSEGQEVSDDLSAVDTFTDAIRITGVDSSRVFTIILSGTWSATVILQRSLESDTGPWEDVTTVSWTANTQETFDDGLDNQIAWYRLYIDAWTSGTVTATLDYALGSISGVVRITGYTSSVSVTADVLSDLGGTDATEVWAEGEWSDFRGWPTAVAFHEGRLWWAGKSSIWGSVTDAFDSFDPDYVGDAGPISRRLGVGPVDNINWLISSNRLLIGGDINEYAARSSSLDEPLTPTQFNVKRTSSQGSAAVQPATIDSNGVFVNRTAIKVFENTLNTKATATFDFSLNDLCQLVPEIGSPEIVRMTVQRQPDTRIHCVRSDGTVALCVFDKTEDVLCWCEIETDGEVEDAVVLPAQTGVTDDYVYYIVKRTIDGATVRYLEKWAQSAETLGGLGEEAVANPFQEFSDFNAVVTDDSVGGVGGLYLFYGATNTEFYLIGNGTDDLIWIHNEDPFVASPDTVDALDDNLIGDDAGCLSREGGNLWISGNSNNYPASWETVRVMNTTTRVVTDFGIVNLGARAYCVAATDTPVRVWIMTSNSLQMYEPDIATATIGSVVWTVSPFGMDGVAMFHPADWISSTEFWTHDSTQMWQWTALTGANAKHLSPTSPVSGQAIVSKAYNSNTNKWYAVTSFTTHYLFEYSDWSATPTANSGNWTLLINYSPLTHAFGRSIYYDATDDILVMTYRQDTVGSIHYAYRYTGEPKVLVDTVYMSEIDGNADIVGYSLENIKPFYRNGCMYVLGTGSSTFHLMEICYDGPEILFDTEGNSIQPGGLVGRLHNLADSYINYSGTPITDVTGLDHLEGEEVVVWGNGYDLGTTATYGQTYTVSGGQITLAAATTNLTVGLPYTAQFQSSKLGLVTQQEVLFGKEKRITHVALVLADTHAKGIRFGPDFVNLDDRPENEDWFLADADRIDTAYDTNMIDFPGEWTTDARICLQAQAPRPCTVLAVKLDMEV